MSKQDQAQQPSIHEIMSRQSKAYADLLKLVREGGVTIDSQKFEGVERFSLQAGATMSGGGSLEEVITAAMILRAGSAIPVVTHGSARAAHGFDPVGGGAADPAQERERVYGHLRTGEDLGHPRFSKSEHEREALKNARRAQELIQRIGEAVDCNVGDDVLTAVQAMVGRLKQFEDLQRIVRLRAVGEHGRTTIVANVEDEGITFSFAPITVPTKAA